MALTAAGKPVWTRWPVDIQLFSIVRAVVERVGADLREPPGSIVAGGATLVFLHAGPLLLVVAARTGEAVVALRQQLRALHDQLLFMLTDKIVERVSAAPSTDVRSFLGPTADAAFHTIAALGNRLPLFLDALPVSTLPPASRSRALAALVAPPNRPAGLVYAILFAGYTIAAWAQRRGRADLALQPRDAILLAAAAQAPAARSADAWLPTCLPQLRPSGFHHAYVAALWETSKGRAVSPAATATGAAAAGQLNDPTHRMSLDAFSDEEYSDGGETERPPSVAARRWRASPPMPPQGEQDGPHAAEVSGTSDTLGSLLPPPTLVQSGDDVGQLRAPSPQTGDVPHEGGRRLVDMAPPAIVLMLVTAESGDAVRAALSEYRYAVARELRRSGALHAIARSLEVSGAVGVGDYDAVECFGVPGVLHCTYEWRPLRQFTSSALPPPLLATDWPHAARKALLRAYGHVHATLTQATDGPPARHYSVAYPDASRSLGAIAGVLTTRTLVLALLDATVGPDDVAPRMEALARAVRAQNERLFVQTPAQL